MTVRVLAAALLASVTVPALADVPKPAALVADGIPAVPDALAAATRPYMESRGATFFGWDERDGSILMRTRFANVPQLHKVAMPMGMRRQITFEAEPVGGTLSPSGDVLVVSKDNGGDEFFQIYTLSQGRLTLLTAGGKSRNGINGWSLDGKLLGFTSTERNGTDNDLYVVDPRNPKSKRLVAQVKGGGWELSAIAPDNRTAIASEYVSVQKTRLHRIDLASGKMTPIGGDRDIAYGDLTYAPDGTLWATSDEDSDVKRLGTLDPKTGKFTPVLPAIKWDVDNYAVSKDGRMVAFVANEAGNSKLSIFDVASRKVVPVPNMPTAELGGMEFSKAGILGFSMNTAKNPPDVFTLDPRSMKLTRWTESETGGLDTRAFVEPEFVSVKSFDGEEVTGYLYRPEPKRHPGKRPLIIDIHGGPEGQWTPGYMGRYNYQINEQGIAFFFPNVRGSTGFGKRFVSLDNGPFKREDSVKDIGAFIDRLSADKGLDAKRFAVTGGSYGGYMCYSSAIHYADRLKGALCNVAISNFVSFLENTQSYRRNLRRVEYGDERDPAQRAKLLEISPMTRIGEIKSPLMVVQGANDPRVPRSEAEQIVKKLRGNGRTVWYLLGENEGHGFGKKENADYEFWTSLLFWDQTLLAK